MVFACQRNSFQQSLITKVKSCAKGQGENEEFYQVTCEDSIFFPEGGGQPYDTGFMNDIPVHQVLRKGSEAIIYVKRPFEVGTEVKQVINWDRRFDHMQQHSGQHLITAIINIEYKIDTVSWWLGEKVSYIALNTKTFTNDQISHIEALVNTKILEQIPVTVTLCNVGDKDYENSRTQGLPDDVADQIRIVRINGIDSNLCCGTHVNNLGKRVLKHLSECLARESKLTKLLNNDPSLHADLVEKLQKNIKTNTRKLAVVFKEVAVFEAEKFGTIRPQPQYYCHYNKEADADYLDCICRNLKERQIIEGTFFMLAVGEDSGNLLLQGCEDDIKYLGPKVCEVLNGKGAHLGTKFKAKVSKLSNFEKAEEILKLYFQNKKSNQ